MNSSYPLSYRCLLYKYSQLGLDKHLGMFVMTAKSINIGLIYTCNYFTSC